MVVPSASELVPLTLEASKQTGELIEGVVVMACIVTWILYVVLTQPVVAFLTVKVAS